MNNQLIHLTRNEFDAKLYPFSMFCVHAYKINRFGVMLHCAETGIGDIISSEDIAADLAKLGLPYQFKLGKNGWFTLYLPRVVVR